jgi:hypothetical protein
LQHSEFQNVAFFMPIISFSAYSTTKRIKGSIQKKSKPKVGRFSIWAKIVVNLMKKNSDQVQKLGSSIRSS